MTIRQNLLFANPKASEKKINDALEKSESTFVYDLENGLDTII
jgi:ABC-type multidrug transport system fused ATPase/permease subunit